MSMFIMGEGLDCTIGEENTNSLGEGGIFDFTKVKSAMPDMAEAFSGVGAVAWGGDIDVGDNMLGGKMGTNSANIDNKDFKQGTNSLVGF